MKNALLSVIGILTILITFSCTDTNHKNESENENEKIIRVTSQNPIEFDMVQNGIITKGIKTPHEFRFVGNDGDFVFTSTNEKEELNVNVESKNGSVSANWRNIVLTIENDEMKTSGEN